MPRVRPPDTHNTPARSASLRVGAMMQTVQQIWPLSPAVAFPGLLLPHSPSSFRRRKQESECLWAQHGATFRQSSQHQQTLLIACRWLSGKSRSQEEEQDRLFAHVLKRSFHGQGIGGTSLAQPFRFFGSGVSCPSLTILLRAGYKWDPSRC